MDEFVKVLAQALSLMQQTGIQQSANLQLDLYRTWRAELETARYADPKRLLRSGYKMYSQADEDGIIEEIFRRIGTVNRNFVEFGVESGVECNSLKLLVEGWTGLWIEGDPKYVEVIKNSHRHWLDKGSLILNHAFVTAESINDLLQSAGAPEDLDLLSIDIDFNDFWVWHAITCIRPRVVVIEYNATWRPPLAVTVPYNPEARWSGGNYFGASLEALAKLGANKGYRLVGCSYSGANAFFVREDACGDHFLEGSASEHYEPPRYFFARIAGGHPPQIGHLIDVTD